jgi:pyruvate/2-oxoglutarate dehydrogenase complex dihydrolipoamide dehydrogenase (E3) component
MSVIDRLAQGLSGLAQKRGVDVMHSRGYFEDSQTLRVETSERQKSIKFVKAIVAVGSKPAMPAAFDLGSKRIKTSTEAFELEEIPEELLVVGGGYLGLELGTVYAALGSKVVLVEEMELLLPGVDADLVQPVILRLDRPDGLTKLIIEPETERILGLGITGHNVGELISEGVVLIEMGATVRDLAEAIHPHPTLSETLMECAEMFYGTATRALPNRKRAVGA